MPAILLRLMMILAHRSPGPMWPNVYLIVSVVPRKPFTWQHLKPSNSLSTSVLTLLSSSIWIQLSKAHTVWLPFLTKSFKISHTPLDSVCNFMLSPFFQTPFVCRAQRNENKLRKVACSVLERSSSAIWQLKVNNSVIQQLAVLIVQFVDAKLSSCEVSSHRAFTACSHRSSSNSSNQRIVTCWKGWGQLRPVNHAPVTPVSRLPARSCPFFHRLIYLTNLRIPPLPLRIFGTSGGLIFHCLSRCVSVF